MRRTTVLLVVAACAIAAIRVADAATSPQALRAAILKAELAKRSVHYFTLRSESGARVRLVADVALDHGIQRFTVSKNGKTGHTTEILVNSKAYLHGDAFALHVLGFTMSDASHYAGKWFSVSPSSPAWGPVAANVTIGSFVRNGVPQTHLSLVRRTVGGKAMRGLRGTGPQGGTLTIYVPKSGPPLPVEGLEVEAGVHPSSGRVTLSHWNEPVHVQAPTRSVPYHYQGP